MTAPAAQQAKQHPHRLRHELEGAGIGGLTVAAGFGGARKFTSNAGYVKKMTKEGTLVHVGPRVHSAAHPDVANLASMKGGRKAKLQHLIDHPHVQARLHEDLRSHTPSKEALHVSNLMHPNGYTNTQIAHSRGKFNRDVLHDPVAGDMHHRVAATKSMIANSNPAHTHEIHRGMRGVEHEVGDTVHFGHFSSFTSTKPIAEAYAKQKGADRPGIYTIPKGKAKAMPLDGTGWASRNHEWLAGGEHRITSKKLITDGQGRSYHHYTMQPVNSSGVSKASPSVDQSWGGAQGARAWFNHGRQTGASYKGRSAATRAHFETGRKGVAGQLSRTERTAFNAGNYSSRALGQARTPKGAAVAGGVAALGAGAAALHHRRKDTAVAKSERTVKDPGYGSAAAVGTLAGGAGAAGASEQHTSRRIAQRGKDFRVQERQQAFLGRRATVRGDKLKHATASLTSGLMAGKHERAAAERARTAVGHGVVAGALGVTGVAIAAHRHAHGKPVKRVLVEKAATKEIVSEVGRGMWKLPGKRDAFRSGMKGTYRGRNALTNVEHRVGGGEAKDAFKGAQDRARASSGHTRSFNAGAKAGSAGHLAAKYKTASIPAAVTAASAPPLIASNHKHAKKESTVAKSAFGVEDNRIEKSFMTAGLGALKDVKAGLGGAKGINSATKIGAAGRSGALATKGKLQPITTALTKTPARAATTAGVAGLGTGLALSNKKN